MNLQHACRTVLVVLLVLCSQAAYANSPTVVISAEQPIASQFQYWEDPDASASLQDVLALPDARWSRQPDGKATLGITSSAYWLRIPVENAADTRLNLVAELGYSQLDDVRFYLLDGRTVTRTLETGDTRPFYPRDVNHPNNLLRFALEPGETTTLMIRVATQGTMVLPLTIWREHEFFESVADEQKLHFFYYGCLSVIILINLAVFLTLREKLYLFYALAIFGYLAFFASIRGFSFQHLYPNAPDLHAHVLMLSMPFLAMFSILFCMEFLKVRQHSPRLRKALIAMLVFEISYFVSVPLMSYNTGIQLASVSALVFFSLLLVAGPIAWAAGVRAGIFFTLAWTPLTIGVLATSGRALGLFPETFFTEYAMQIGSGLEAFILTLALADRLYREREQKIRAQADSLRQEKAHSEAQDRLNDVMSHDPVTGLPNRNRFEWMIDEELRAHPERRYMVGVARITRLKDINRTLGLERSERLLRSIAEHMSALAEQLPMLHTSVDQQGRVERVYQLSGDSFGLLVDVERAGDNFQPLDQALKQLAEPVLLDHLAIEPHPRFGAASYPEHGRKASELIRNAHVGMEMAPHGPFETGFYSRSNDIYDERRLTLMSDLKEALTSGTTELHYQPKMDLRSGQIIGFEALIRWQHPERGWVPPIDFIPLAEKTGVITQLTHWVIDQALSDLRTLQKIQPGLGMAINVSARDLLSAGLEEQFAQSLARHQLEAGHVTVELTETAAMDDPEKGLEALGRLSALGLRISIDDFGAGYSSLSYLKQIPASELKLDRTLVHDIQASDSARVIVETAITMGHTLGYQVVAEGVESGQDAARLKAMGADLLQGFCLSRPQSLTDTVDWLEKQRQPEESRNASWSD